MRSRGTLYNRVGVINRHVFLGRDLDFVSRFVGGFDLVLPLLVLTHQGSLSEFRGGRLVPPTIYPVTSLPTMIRCSDSRRFGQARRRSREGQRCAGPAASANPNRAVCVAGNVKDAGVMTVNRNEKAFSKPRNREYTAMGSASGCPAPSFHRLRRPLTKGPDI
jgi:hypothetical protein